MNSDSLELNRLLTAAIVNRHFRKTLLTNPAKAIENGYHNEVFDLTPPEYQLVLSIKATTIEEFARKQVELLAKTEADTDGTHKTE